MKDVTEAFDDYWKTHFENLVLPINQKREGRRKNSISNVNDW